MLPATKAQVKKLGAVVRAERERLGMTQFKLSETCGFGMNYIGSIERATKNPTLQSLSAIASGLGMSISELFRRANL